MEFLLLLALAALLFGPAVRALTDVRRRERRRREMTVWRRAARDARVVVSHESSDRFEPTALRGHLGDLHVRLESNERSGYERGTRILVRGPAYRNGGVLSVRREGLGTAAGKQLGAREVEIGDPAFDRQWYIEGSAPLALATLDGATRHALSTFLGEYGGISLSRPEVRASLEESVLSVELRDGPSGPVPEELAALLGQILQFARALSLPSSRLADRLARNLASEPEVGVRAQIVQTLLREFPEHPATRRALRAACSDSSDDIRLRAGVALGDQGRETLVALAAREDADDSCRARAVAALGPGLDTPRLAATLQQARDSRQLLTARACLDALAGSAEEGREALLLSALSDEASAVRVAAARGLGLIGTVAAVASLRELESAGGELRSAARQAIAEIQARQKGAAPGQLSLPPEHGGRLSFAGRDSGQLSVAEDNQDKAIADERPEEVLVGGPKPSQRQRSTQ